MSLTTLTEAGFKRLEVVIRQATDEEEEKHILVRGLAPLDVFKLFRIHGPAMISLFNEVAGGDLGKLASLDTSSLGDADVENVATLVMILVDQAPDLLADVIVLAADEQDTVGAVEVAKRLPMAVQVDALEKIATLTFVEHGGLEKFLETVLRLLTGANGLLEKLRTSTAGSISSPEPSPSSEETATQT